MIRTLWQGARDLTAAFVIITLGACSTPQISGPLALPASERSRVEPDVTIHVLHSFGRGKDGYAPQAGLLHYNLRFYGTTQYGGVGGNGTVFELRSIGVEQILHSFGKPPDGGEPVATLVQLNGVLYGTTKYGGRDRNGTVFGITASGKERRIYSFGSRSADDGANPVSNVTVLNGHLYGTTLNGGKYGKGTVYEITLSSPPTERVLHSFGSGNDGAYPKAGLIATKNVLYGTTSAGGGSTGGSYGTVFRIETNGTEHVVFAFECAQGAAPVASLLQLGGALYGTTSGGGTGCPSAGDGTVFTLSSGSEERVVHAFGDGSTDGTDPLANLVASNGRFYGTTSEGGTYTGGMVFSLTPAGYEKVLHPFGEGTDGNRPAAALINADGWFYGTTAGGGKYGGGIIYKFH